MAAASFRKVCVDAIDPLRLGPWWAGVIHQEWRAYDHGEGGAFGPTRGHTIWFNRVPEPKSVKHRVHLDIYSESIAGLEGLGARVVDDNPAWRWTTMADPEAGEFCAFIREEIPADRVHGLVVDCADHHAIAEWWGAAYGAEIVHHDDGYSTVQQIPGMPIETMDFVPVPEPKTVKNRVHWDVTGDSDALIGAGAKLLRRPDGDTNWTVLADPEGNEFCVFSPDS
jgi:hypothetical protein